jgi:4-methylaminobutanoate oxidase (formaldehyde-forming)
MAAGERPARRLRSLLVGGEEYVPVYGGEAVLADGEVVGRLRSAGYGFTVARTIGLAYLPAELETGAQLEVEALGERVGAVVAEDTLVDPASERILA